MTVFNDVNQHCLDRIFDLATEKTVIAAEDIFDANGTKLWAKGSEISAELKEKLAQRRLRSPLELSLAIEQSVTTGIVVDDCLAAIEADPLLLRLAGSKPAEAALSRLRLAKLPGPIRLLLTTAHNSFATSYRNALYTVAISAGFAARHNLPPQDLEILLVTALLHDLGEIYINPEYLAPGRTISTAEWTTVATHPTVGHLVARDIGRLPEAVGKGIAQHHERMDGSGYPAMLTQAQISPIGAIVAVADAVAAIIGRGHASAAYQACLALKIVPEEFDRSCVSFVEQALHDLAGDMGGDHEACTPLVRTVAGQVAAVDALIHTQLAGAPSGLVRETLQVAERVCANVAKAMRSTGVEQLIRDQTPGDGEFCGEACHVAREIRWRLRNVARNIHLRVSGRGSPEDLAVIQPLLSLLEGD